MFTFTVPSAIKGKTVKNGRYAKMKILLSIRAYIAKLFNNSDGIKYFMNIELGKHFSNPHLHIQVWHSDTSANTTDLIYNKTINKFNLNKKRCYISVPENEDIDIYHYLIKDYSKNLSDNDLWNLETQKKRMRKHLGSKIRFYSKSSDKYTKNIYRVVYKWGIVRNLANKYLDSFLDNFFKFTKKRLPKFSIFISSFSKLREYRTRGEDSFFYSSLIIFEVYYSARDPPFYFYGSKKRI